MKDRETSNPTSRFATSSVEYDAGDGPPPSSIQLIEDHSRSVLAHNDSPDIGFRWSVNPYRGCMSACAYCLGSDTQVLMGDARTKRIADLKIGDEIYGTTMDGGRRRYVRTHVKDVWSTIKLAYRIELSDGTEVIASADHRFLSRSGWKYVNGPDRPHLTPDMRLLGTGRFAIAPVDNEDYRRGYLSGLIRGDGTPRVSDYSGAHRGKQVVREVRHALADLEALHRAHAYLASLEVEAKSLAQSFQVAAARPGYRAMHAIRTSSRHSYERVRELIAPPAEPTLDWRKGFLSGAFDAAGSRNKHALRIANQTAERADEIVASLRRLEFDAVVERANGESFNVRLRGGLSEHLRFLHTTGAAITRKWSVDGQPVSNRGQRSVVAITKLEQRRLYDITTGTGDFIANGIISHNCYARPTHEYLDLGAGTDFDTKIVYKPQAAELLRAAFDKPSWQGELVMFSGVTDCYQPVEAKLELTRKCLEVCLEYRNPVAVISKHALIERDVGLLAELAKEAGCHVSVSLAWVDAALARKIEPWAPAPERRLKVIETLAKAGISVGVMCAPIMPGLNDDQMVRVLEAARDAGATSAGWVLLRLPGAVKQVFEDRVRVALPLAADKIMHRIRETRGGDKLYDSTFGTRGRGEGPYAQTLAAMFEATTRRLGFNERDFALESRFQRPPKLSPQLTLFQQCLGRREMRPRR